MSVKLMGTLVEVDGKNLRFVMEPNDNNHTKFKLDGLSRLYAGKSPVAGQSFYVRDAPVEVLRNGEMCLPLDLMNMKTELVVGVRKYKTKKDGVTIVGWALDLQKMTMI